MAMPQHKSSPDAKESVAFDLSRLASSKPNQALMAALDPKRSRPGRAMIFRHRPSANELAFLARLHRAEKIIAHPAPRLSLQVGSVV